MKNFIDYCLDFYGKGGLYDMSATRSEVERAVRVREVFKTPEFEGDTVDRELIRDIIIEMRGR